MFSARIERPRTLPNRRRSTRSTQEATDFLAPPIRRARAPRHDRLSGTYHGTARATSQVTRKPHVPLNAFGGVCVAAAFRPVPETVELAREESPAAPALLLGLRPQDRRVLGKPQVSLRSSPEYATPCRPRRSWTGF